MIKSVVTQVSTSRQNRQNGRTLGDRRGPRRRGCLPDGVLIEGVREEDAAVLLGLGGRRSEQQQEEADERGGRCILRTTHHRFLAAPSHCSCWVEWIIVCLGIDLCGCDLDLALGASNQCEVVTGDIIADDRC